MVKLIGNREEEAVPCKAGAVGEGSNIHLMAVAKAGLLQEERTT
jgi:hypothetical protein